DELHVPPVLGVTLAVEPIHTLVAPPKVGEGFTVKLIVLVQPVEVLVNVKVTVPALTPVTTPPLVMVATPVLDELHVPPVLGVTLAVEPIHTLVAPPKVGEGFTVKLIVLVQPVEVLVNVKVTVPALTPVTTPPLVIAAPLVSDELHVPPVLGVTLA